MSKKILTNGATAQDLSSLKGTAVDTNTGVVGGGTQRVTLATDVALPTGTNSLGQVTANAGTNLNTSLLALEAGGNLANAAASLDIIDDWDESDRAKVNPIAGQAGVQGNSGVVTALTQRVVLATDVALPAGTNAIGKLSANSGVDIGDVDVTSIVPGTGATNLGKAIDTATGATDTGVLALGTRDDVLAALTPIDGDNVQLRTNSRGAVWNEHDLNPGTFTTLFSDDLDATTEFTGGTTLTCLQSWVEFEVAISKTGSPTRFQVMLYWANDGGTNYARSDHGWEQQIFYVAAEVSGTIYRSFLTPRRGGILQIRCQAAGTATGSNYFTVVVKARNRTSG